MTASRFQDDGRTVYDFGAEFLVHCPQCSQRARVAPLREAQPQTDATQGLFAPRRCVCPACGFVRVHDEMGFGISADAKDWYFGLPLWLQTPCCGHTLWAYNADHLAYLKAFVCATLRERAPHDHPYRNRTLASRLPLWMKRQKHRAEVLNGLARLQRLLD